MTPEEKETIVQWNMASKKCSVYTYQKGIWQKLERFGFKPTEVFRNSVRIVAKEFVLPKRCISIRKPKILSEQQRIALSERLKSSRQAKPLTKQITG